MMTGQHFKEIVETICMTTGLKKYEIQDRLGLTTFRFHNWQTKGVPSRMVPVIRPMLKHMLMHSGTWRKETKHNRRWDFHG
jgi:hypothetical protein